LIFQRIESFLIRGEYAIEKIFCSKITLLHIGILLLVMFANSQTIAEEIREINWPRFNHLSEGVKTMKIMRSFCKKIIITPFLIFLFINSQAIAQDFWERTNGPFGGDIFSLTINTNGDIFAGTLGGGVFRSTDNGNWTEINSGLTNLSVFAFAINTNGDIFAGTLGGGVFRSTDNGNNWTEINSGLTNIFVRSLAINTSGDVFAGSDGGVFRSTDNGGSWTQVNTGLTTTTSVSALAINTSGDVFAGSVGRVFRSTDNGGSWTRINNGLAATRVQALAINTSGDVFAGTFGGVFRSTDNGNNWTQINNGLTATDVEAFAINTSGDIFAGTFGGGVFRSTDNGNNWTEINTGLTDTQIHSLAINANGDIFAGTRVGGVFRSVESTTTGDQEPPILGTTFIPEAPANQSLTIQTTITDNVAVQSSTLFYRRGGASSYSSSGMTDTGGDIWVGTIPSSFVTERGVEFYFSAQDLTGNSTTNPSTNPQSNPVAIQVTSNDLSFSSPNLAYRMISVPIDLDNSSPSSVLEANLGPYDDTQWRLLKYINGINQEFTKASIGNFDPGRGFWLITREAKPLLTGSGKSVTTEQNYVIALPPGWSQIGNPFAFPVNWQDVIRNGDVEDVLVGYQGSTNDATGYDFTRTQLQPFQGYFVNNREAASVTIEIPPQSATGTTSLAKQAGLPDLSTLQSDEWFVQLTAQSDRFLDKDNYLGVLDDAADTWDRNDFSEAPFFDSFVSLYFPHEDWQVYPGLYTGDFRSINAEGHFWDFHVKSNIANSEVVLNLANIQNLPSEMDIVLIDKASRISISLLEQDSYTFASGADGAERDFRIVVGKSDFVDSNDLDFSGIPETFTLSQNYPNPFNPETSIDYELPLESEVKIAVFNLLGQQIRSLFNGKQNPGRYTISWDGKSDNGLSVATGVYLVRMQAGKFVSVRKVLLTK